MKSNFLGFLAAIATCCAIAVPSTAQDAEAPKPETVKVFDALTLTIPGGWKSVPPKSRIVEREFTLVLDGPTEPQTRVTLMAAGGGVKQNIERWEGQFSDGKEAEVEQFASGENNLYFVKLDGTYNETMGGGPFSGGKKVKRENYVMLGGIIEMKDGRQYFIKMIGPDAEVTPQTDAFKKMLKDVK